MVELESGGELTRRQVAWFLREFADELEDGGTDDTRDVGTGGSEFSEDAGEPGGRDERVDRTEGVDDVAEESEVDTKRVTLIVGGDSATVTVPDAVSLDVEVESRSPMLLGSGVKQAITFDMSWEIEDPDQLDEDWIEVE